MPKRAGNAKVTIQGIASRHTKINHVWHKHGTTTECYSRIPDFPSSLRGETYEAKKSGQESNRMLTPGIH